MNGKKALYYAAIAIAILLVVGMAVSVLLSILALLRLAVYGAVLIGLAYGLYKAGSWLRGSDDTHATDSIRSPRSSSSSVSGGGSQDRQDRLRQQYVEGQISEAEFEERIARELETEDLDDIERELERER